MHKKYKNAVLAALLGLFLIVSFNVLSAQGKSQTKDPNHTDILTQSQVKADNVVSGNFPIIQFPEDSFDFGNVHQESEVSHIFKVHNAGNAPLKIISAKAS